MEYSGGYWGAGKIDQGPWLGNLFYASASMPKGLIPRDHKNSPGKVRRENLGVF